MREVIVVAAEDPELLEQFLVLREPVHAGSVDPGGVGDHEAVAPVGLRLAGVEL
jgi:hypothetical protein